ncbi:hypothetical protein JCM3765_001843 [Sporobolomyces pararoseus]
MARRTTRNATRRRDESPPSDYLPPRRSLPIQPRSPSLTPLDYIPPNRSQSRHTRRVSTGGEDEDYLSADAATRIMMEKWDLLDSTISPPPPSESRGQRRTTRSNSMPTAGMGRRKSRVSEWEEWKPEMERIRLAQVEMEQKLEEEAKAHQLASMEKDRGVKARQIEQDRPEKGKKKLMERKSTPRYSNPRRDEEDSDYGIRNARSSSPESIPESTKAVYEESEIETKSRKRGSRNRRKEDLKPSIEFFAPRSASRRAHRTLVKSPSPAARDSPARKSPGDIVNQAQEVSTAPQPAIPVNRSRSSRRKPRPATPPDETRASSTPSSIPASSTPSERRSRSSRTRRRPSLSPPPVQKVSSKPTESETDLLATATHAAEQVSEVVTNAFTKVIPGLFGIKK